MDPRLLASLALALLLFGAISRRAERSAVTAPMAFVALGWLLGSDGLGWLRAERELVHGLAELTLVLVLFTDASRIDLKCLRREESLPARLLAFGLPLTIAAGTLAALAVFPGLGMVEALLLAAILSPTDAALGQAVVSSPLVPLRIRQTLNVESGLNDGIALPVVLIAASLASVHEATADAGYWLRFAALQLTLGPLVGIGAGWAGGRLVGHAMRTGWINEVFQRLSVLGIAGVAFAGAELVGGNGFIAAFVAGLVLGSTARPVCTRLYEFGEAEGQLLTLLVFLVFAGVIVPESREHWDGRALVYALLSLTALRMLPVSLSLLGSGLRPASHLFLGWFGPRGLASLLFAMLAMEAVGPEPGAQLSGVVMLTVLLSVFAHGMTAYPAARRYSAHVEAAGARAAAERAEAMEHPVRIRHSYGS